MEKKSNKNEQEYIESLENSIDFLKREIEKLRESRDERREKDIQEFLDSTMPEPLFYKCNSIPETETVLFEYLSQKYSALEAIIISFTNDQSYVVYALDKYNVSLSGEYKKLSESGVIDWLFTNSSPVIIPNLTDENSSKPTSLILCPFDGTLGKFLLIVKTSLIPESLTDKELEVISRISSNGLLRIISEKLSEEPGNQLANETKTVSDYSLLLLCRVRKHLDRFLKIHLQGIESNVSFIKRDVGNRLRRINGIENDLEEMKDLLHMDHSSIDLTRFIRIWEEVLKNEGIDFVSDYKKEFDKISPSPELLFLADMILEFSYQRYEGEGDIKLFRNNNLNLLMLTIKTQLMRLGHSEPITNHNYEMIQLPADLVKIFITAGEIGYYLTITEENDSTFFEVTRH